MSAVSTFFEDSAYFVEDAAYFSAGNLSPLGSLEKLPWPLDPNSPSHFAVAAQIEGKVEVEAWRSAIDGAQSRHPLLSVGIEAGADSQPHFRHINGAPIPLRIVEGDVLQRCEMELEKELSTPFSAQDAPLIRAVLLREKRRAILILAAHNSIADGISLTLVIRDILCALTGEQLHPSPFIPSQEEMSGLPEGVPHTAIRHAANTTRPAEEMDLGKERKLTPHIRQLSLTPELTEKLRERARAEGTTTHGALCSALVLAGRQLVREWNGKAVRILSPISTRKVLNAYENCGLYVSAGLVSFEPQEESARFWDMARYARQNLSVARSFGGATGVIGAIDQIVRKRLDAETTAQVESNACPFEMMVTNLGNFPFGTTFGQLRLRNLWGPAAISGQPKTQTIGAATANGALTLVQTSYLPIEALLEVTKQFLISACGDGKYR